MKPFEIVKNQVILSQEVKDYVNLAKMLETEFNPERHKYVVYTFKDIEKAAKYIKRHLKQL